MDYHYWIVYRYNNLYSGISGWGGVGLVRNKLIDSPEEVQGIITQMESEHPDLGQVIVTNWIQFDEKR